MIDPFPETATPVIIESRLAEAVVEALPAAVAVLDTNDRLIAWNSRWAEAFATIDQHACRVGVAFGDVLAEALAAGLYDPSAASVLDLVAEPSLRATTFLAPDPRGRPLRHWRAVLPGIGTMVMIDDASGAQTPSERPGVDPETELADRVSLLSEMQRRIDAGLPSALLMIRIPEHGGSVAMSRSALALVEAFGADGVIGRLRGLELGILVSVQSRDDLGLWRRRVVEAVAGATVVRVSTGVLPRDGSAIDAVRAVAVGLDAGVRA